MTKEYERFKRIVVEYLRKSEGSDKVMMYKGEKSFSAKSLADEIENSLPDGLETLESLMKLTLDMLIRNNIEMKEKYSILSQLTAYKEALSKLISRYETLEYSIMAHPDYVLGDENDEWHTFLSCGEEVLTKAKALIE